MLVRPVNQQWETWKRLAIMAVALALGVTFASVVGATDKLNSDRAPGRVPPVRNELTMPSTGQNSAITSENADLGCEISKILEMHRVRNYEAAMTAWNELTLPPETAVWRSIALGQASLATQRFEQAEEFLGRAINSQPDNPLAYYFRGVLRVQQAYLASDWQEDLGLPHTRLVAFTPHRVVPNTKAMYELAAMLDLERAIELACAFQTDEAIVPDRYQTLASPEPTARDLLIALGADKFEAKAHNILSYLFLDRGELEAAEQHMDAVAQGGLEVVYGYSDLGNKYRASGRHADAMRAYLKATKFSAHKTSTLFNAIRSLRDLITEE